MNTNNLLSDIRELNLSYLLLIQRLINTDRVNAMTRLNIDKDMADLLSTAPNQQLTELAQCNQLLCRLPLDNCSQIAPLTCQHSADTPATGHRKIKSTRLHATKSATHRSSYRRDRGLNGRAQHSG